MEWQHKKEEWVRKLRFLTNLNAIDCCRTTNNEKLIYVPTYCKLQNHVVSSKIRSLASALLGKVHALLQYALAFSSLACLYLFYIEWYKAVSFLLRFSPVSMQAKPVYSSVMFFFSDVCENSERIKCALQLHVMGYTTMLRLLIRWYK